MASTISRPALRVLRNITGPPSKPFTCTNCRTQPYPLTRLSASTRSFTSTPHAPKKSSASSKSARKTTKVEHPDITTHIPGNKATATRDAEVDPYDHSELETGIAAATARLKDAITKTRDAGRVTPDMLEALPVELNIKHPDQSHRGRHEGPHHESTRLGSIASVAPRGGRMMQIFAAEQGHIKGICAAVMASEHSLTPEVDAHNPLLVLVPVPPATAETRAQAAAEAKKCFERASLEVRNARGDAQKRFRRMELAKLAVQDEIRKAHKGMEEVARRGQEEIKKVYEGALKALQQ